MTAAVRENARMLQGHFGRASWKVALEPERRTPAEQTDTVQSELVRNVPQ